MGIKQQREKFIAQLVHHITKDGFTSPFEALDTARKFLRLSQTHGRLCCAYCNGDWPYHGSWNLRNEPGLRHIPRQGVSQCQQCERDCVTRSMKYNGRATGGYTCKKCRIEAQLKALAESSGFGLRLQQDPRGWTVHLIINGTEIGVPQHD